MMFVTIENAQFAIVICHSVEWTPAGPITLPAEDIAMIRRSNDGGYHITTRQGVITTEDYPEDVVRVITGKAEKQGD
jgi:hypothetical protein